MDRDRLITIARHTGIHRAFRPFYSGMGSILMFHRVARKAAAPRIAKNARNEVSPEYLEALIRHFLSTGHEIISLDTLHQNLAVGETRKKGVVFTFDDGYEDVYSLAYPIFRKYGLPFTVYVSTNYPDGKAVLWWYLLEDLVLKHDPVEFMHEGTRRHFATSTPEQREAAFHAMRTLIMRQPADALGPLLEKIFGPYGMDVSRYSRALTLDWNQLAIMSEDPSVTIGAHTVNHFALNALDIGMAEQEINRSREIIEARIGKKVEHFSYPFGSRSEAGAREFGLVKKAGFKTATTTRIGNIFAGHRNHMESLPRIPVSGGREDIFAIEAMTSGFIPALSHAFRRVVTD